VPLLWEENAYPSLKPLASWIRDFKQRINFMSNWISAGNPSAYWLSGLFYP
jgi:dynein heavy chain